MTYHIFLPQEASQKHSYFELSCHVFFWFIQSGLKGFYICKDSKSVLI